MSAPAPDAQLRPVCWLAPQAISAQLLPEEAGNFDREYRTVMAEATRTLDLTCALAMFRHWERVARLTQHDPAAHRRMPATGAALNAGQDVPMVSWGQVKAELGL